FGPKGEYEIAYGYQGIQMDFQLLYVRSSSDDQTPSAAPSTSVSGWQFQFNPMYVNRVTDNLALAAGLEYTWSKLHDRMSNVDTITNGLEIVPFQIRAGIY